MYTFCIGLIFFLCLVIIGVVLVQNPKSNMASNFGAANQVVGVRETANFLEKITWGAAIVVFVLCLVATLVMGNGQAAKNNTNILKDAQALQERVHEEQIPSAMPQVEIPAEAAEETPAAETK